MSADLSESVREAIKEAFAGITPLVRYNAAVNAINEATDRVLAIPGLLQAWDRSQANEHGARLDRAFGPVQETP